jgi:hypothetical protein
MSDVERILRNTAATVRVTFYADSTPVDADGTVTVAVKKADGSNHSASGTAAHEGAAGSGTYRLTIPAQSTLDDLTLDWTGTFSGNVSTIRTRAEIVGGFMFTIPELRASDTQLANTTKYPDSKLSDIRDFVEDEFEEECHRSFTPRFHREVLSGDGDYELRLSKAEPIEIQKLVVDDDDVTGDWDLVVDSEDAWTLIRRDGVWPFGYENVVIEYTYGMTQVPRTVRNAGLRRARNLLFGANTRYDDRAISITVPDTGTMQLATPGRSGYRTGIPDVDKVLDDYDLTSGAGVF